MARCNEFIGVGLQGQHGPCSGSLVLTRSPTQPGYSISASKVRHEGAATSSRLLSWRLQSRHLISFQRLVEWKAATSRFIILQLLIRLGQLGGQIDPQLLFTEPGDTKTRITLSSLPAIKPVPLQLTCRTLFGPFTPLFRFLPALPEGNARPDAGTGEPRNSSSSKTGIITALPGWWDHFACVCLLTFTHGVDSDLKDASVKKSRYSPKGGSSFCDEP